MIDLHLHSYFSDGSFSPSEVVERAVQKGVSVLSLTDHDSIAGIDEAKCMCENLGINFITGVEFEASTDTIRSRYIHILGYDFTDINLISNYLNQLRSERIALIHKYVDRLQSLGIFTDFDEIASLTPGLHITAYHIPNFLYKKGYYSNFSAAKKDFINPDGKYYIERNFYDVPFIINLILKAGGIPVLAHPCRLPQKNQDLDFYISYLTKLGISGIETYYPEHSDDDIIFYQSIANKYGLLQTAGSDWHSENSITIGMEPPDEALIISNLLSYNKGSY